MSNLGNKFLRTVEEFTQLKLDLTPVSLQIYWAGILRTSAEELCKRYVK